MKVKIQGKERKVREKILFKVGNASCVFMAIKTFSACSGCLRKTIPPKLDAFPSKKEKLPVN